MKLKGRTLAFVAIVAGILLLVWMSGGFREGFTQVPVITKDDIQAAGAKQPGSPALQQLMAWLNTNYPSLTGTFVSSTVMYFYIFGTQYSGITTPPSFDDFFNMMASGYAAYGMSGVTGDELKKSYLSRGDDISDAIYKYYFGTPMPTPPSTTPPASPPAGSPASSAPPMTATIPSPCSHSFKSIPGGTMEFRCFDS